MGQKIIDNIETNDMNFKHLETAKDIVISPKNEFGDPQRPDATHTWSAKVSDGTNYVGDYAVKIDGTSLIVDSEDFTKLPVGNYQLEVWEQWTDADGASQLSIYPSPQQTIPFRIYANIPDQAEKEIKQIGFQDVVDQAVMDIGMNYVFKVNTIDADQTATVVQTAADGKNYVTFNIPRGAKGDKGDQGLQGDKGDHGISIWSMRMAAGGNVSGRSITDLYNASATNLPAVNDLVVQPDGNVFSVISVTNDATSGASGDGGGTFDLGPALFSIKGEKGDKGDTGTVDNAGLTNAPAFQALQTQVNNSAVGTNLIAQSDLQPGYMGIASGAVIEYGTSDFNSANYIPTNGATVFTFSSPDYVFKGSNASLLAMYDSNKNYLGFQNIISPTQTLSKSNVAYIRFSINYVDEGGTAGKLSDWLSNHRYKLEKGSVATDWCPNPSEILTQADYAKIKAAIVALGGSLS